MIRAFFSAVVLEVITLLVCAAVVAGVTEKMSARQAGIGLLVFGVIDLVVVSLAIWVYRLLGAHWGGSAPTMWSVVLFAVMATLAGAAVFLVTMVLLNR